MKELAKQGLQMAGQAILGIGLNKMNERSQVKQQGKLNEQQIKGQKELADYNQKLQYEMWQKTNYAPQVAELKEAGLNTALMYGMGGGGGTTTGSGGTGTVTGGQAASAAATTANQMQMALMLQQQQLLKAQTEKTTAEAVKIKGVDTDQTKAETAFKQILTKYQNESLDEQLEIINNEVMASEGRMRQEIARGEVEGNTAVIKARQDKIKQEAINTALEAIAIKQGIQLDQAKISEITNGIQQKWKELNINETRSRYEHQDRVKAIEEYTTNALKVAGIHAVGNVVGDVTRIATKRFDKGSTTTQTKWDDQTTTYDTRPNR